MTLLRFVARLFGWLLTPLVAWAASFLGATAVALVAPDRMGPRAQLIATVAGGGIAAAVGLALWLRLLRRSPKLQETLQVAADATPLVVSEDPQ
ncbi:MAG: hypothetical protein SFV24_01160 [Gemmatimonadales bacterium]|nr:hypothetical protein [Gemmatimonadota bacterium]MDX2056382.1 hypothetical protein [Gemmatimonadales bacterium]